MIAKINSSSGHRGFIFLYSRKRIVVYLFMIIAICIVFISCGDNGEGLPPAETPTFSMIVSPHRGSPHPDMEPIPELFFSQQASNGYSVFPVEEIAQLPGTDWLLGFRIVLTYRALTEFQASYNNTPITWEGSLSDSDYHAMETSTGGLALHFPPIPTSINDRLRNGENIMWNSFDTINDAGYIMATFTIMIGVGNSNIGALEFWTESANSTYSGTDKVSNRLVLVLMPRNLISVTWSLSGSYSNSSLVLEWNIPNCINTQISGFRIPAPGRHISCSGTLQERSISISRGDVVAYSVDTELTDLPGIYFHRNVRILP